MEIKIALRQEQTDNTDGMDLCLCKIEHKSLSKTSNFKTANIKITFSGAKRNLFYYPQKSKQLELLKADRKTIGGILISRNKTLFTNHDIFLDKGDILYLTTDGYIDQNNSKRKRYGTPKLKVLLNQIATKSLPEQQQILETTLDNWQGSEEQRDDITVIGVKL